MGNSFGGAGARQCPAPGSQPVRDSPVRPLGGAVVAGKQFRLSVHGLRKAFFQNPGDSRVYLPPPGQQLAFVGCVPQQRVLEKIAVGLFRAPGEHDLGAEQLLQGLVQRGPAQR